MPEILAVLPMKGSSRSVPYKSISPVLGRPLCHYSIVEAKKSRLISRLIAFTGDPKVLEVVQQYGVEVPVLQTRAEEDMDDLVLFQRCLAELSRQESYRPDIVFHLKATSPLRTVADIDGALQALLDDPAADSVRGVTDVELTPFKMYWYRPDGKYIDYFLREKFPEIFAKFPEPSSVARQHFPTIIRHVGVVDAVRSGQIVKNNSMSGRNILPYYVEKLRTASINNPGDVPYVEYLLSRFGRDKDD